MHGSLLSCPQPLRVSTLRRLRLGSGGKGRWSRSRRGSRAQPHTEGEESDQRCPVTEVAEAEGQGQDLGCEVWSIVGTLESAVQVGVYSG